MTANIAEIIELFRTFEGRPSPLSEDTQQIRSMVSHENVQTFCLENFHANDLVNAIVEIKSAYRENAGEVYEFERNVQRIQPRVVSTSDDPFII